jgi:hypothetical protein
LQIKLQEKSTSGFDQSDYSELQVRYDELSASHNTLESSYQALQKNYDSLSASYNDLERERDELLGQLESLPTVSLSSVPEGGRLLTELDVFNGNSRNWSINSGGKEDTLGYDYSGTSSFIVVGYYHGGINGGLGYSEFFIDGKYSRLTGNIAPHSTASGEYKSRIQVYGDGKLLYESQEVGIRTDVFSFEIGSEKLSGVRFLKVVQEGYDNIPLLLTDWTLS